MTSLITYSSRSSVEQMENFSAQKELKRQEIEDQFQSQPELHYVSKSDWISMNKDLNQQCKHNQEKERFLMKLIDEYKALRKQRRKPVSQVTDLERFLREAHQKNEQAQEERKAVLQMMSKEKQSMLIWKERIDKIRSVLKKISNAHEKALQSQHIARNCLVKAHNHMVSTKSNMLSNHKEFHKQIKQLKSLQNFQQQEIDEKIEVLCLFDQQIAINLEHKQKNAEVVEKLMMSFKENKQKSTLAREFVEKCLQIINSLVKKHKKPIAQDLDEAGAETIIENYKFFHFQEASLSRYFTELTDEFARKKKEIEVLLQEFNVKRPVEEIPMPIIQIKASPKGFESDRLILLVFSSINNIIFNINKSLENVKKYIHPSSQTYKNILESEKIIRSRTKFVFRTPFIKPSLNTRLLTDSLDKEIADAIKNFPMIRNFVTKDLIQHLTRNWPQEFVPKLIKKAYKNCYGQFDYRIVDLYTIISELSSDSEVEIKEDTIYLPVNKQGSLLNREGSLIERYKTNEIGKQNVRKDDYPRLSLSNTKKIYKRNSIRDNSKNLRQNSFNVFNPREVLKEMVKLDRQLLDLRSTEKKAITTLSSPEIKRPIHTPQLKQARYKSRFYREI